MILKLIRKIEHEISEGSFKKKEEKAGGREEGRKKREKSSWILKRTIYVFGTYPSIDRSMKQNPESRINIRISPLIKVTFQESRERIDYLKMMPIRLHM